jgi:trigger factor
MTIEVEAERVDAAREKALRKLGPRAKVPGFRPGKAPKDLVRRYFGEERILDEALDDLVPDIYREAVEGDETIDPIARPRLVVETTEPLVVKATIPVRPTITLGDYAAIRVEPEDVTVDEARVDETLTVLRRRAATLEPVDRPLQWRDIARITLEGTVEVEGAAPTLVGPGGETLVASKQREPMVSRQEAEIQLVEDRAVLFPGFEEALIGHAKGETIEFDLAVPEAITDEKFAGKQVHFTVTIEDTKEEVLPDLDDAFAKQVGEGFDTVDVLRDRIRADILKAEEERRDNRYHDEILGQLVDGATIDFPPVLLESEIDRLLHEQTGQQDHAEVEKLLAQMGKTEEQARDELRPIAEMRLRRSLALTQVTENEKIAVAEDEIDAEIETMVTGAGAQADQLRQLFSGEAARDRIRSRLLTRKTLDLLVGIATGAPAVGAQPAAPEDATAGAEPADATPPPEEGQTP